MTVAISRRAAAQRLFYGLFAGTALLRGQEYGRVRDLVARVQDDLEKAAAFFKNNEKERERYHNVQHKLSEFDRDLRAGHFEKGKLDDAIDDLKNVVKNNTLESHHRDALAADLAELRTMRDER